eukprot:scaffold64442_cov27-Phaeocystis_antarctica.AAC.1
MRCGARCGPLGGRAWVGGGASGMHEEGPTEGWGAQDTCGAHRRSPVASGGSKGSRCVAG